MKKILSKLVEILLVGTIAVLLVSYIVIVTVGYLENAYTIWHVIAICIFAGITTAIVFDILYSISEWRNGKKEE